MLIHEAPGLLNPKGLEIAGLNTPAPKASPNTNFRLAPAKITESDSAYYCNSEGPQEGHQEQLHYGMDEFLATRKQGSQPQARWWRTEARPGRSAQGHAPRPIRMGVALAGGASFELAFRLTVERGRGRVRAPRAIDA